MTITFNHKVVIDLSTRIPTCFFIGIIINSFGVNKLKQKIHPVVSYLFLH